MNRLIVTLLLLYPGVALANPVISEFLTSNAESLTSEMGTTPDWIEIQNSGGNAVNLAGYTLTDDPEDTARWTFPSLMLAPGDYLIIFASGENRAEASGELHTDFKLARSGGYLGLYAPDGTVASEFVNYPPQRRDISYGMISADAVYFDKPTPGEANGNKGLEGFVADTKFSIDRGYYNEPISVEITTATEGATIIYTTDGRIPSRGSLFTGVIGDTYEGPLTIDETTTLRAFAYKSGFQSSNVDTQSYIFLEHSVGQTGDELVEKWGDDWGSGEDADYEMDPRITEDPRWKDTIVDDFKTLPILSLAVEPEEFFSLNKGIYPGRIGQDGIDIPASAELLHPDGKEGFQIDCAVRIVGQTSPQRWKIKKLSMRLRFDTDFGPGTLRYPLYDDPSAGEEFNTLTVDARHNNTWAYNGGSIPTQQREWAQYLRDQTAADLHRAMGGVSPHGRYVFVFVNGTFWGMYNLHERPDDAFQEVYQGGNRDEWKVTRHGDPGQGGVNVSGEDTLTLYREFNSFVRDADDPEVYAQIEQQLDIDDFINYMIVNLGLANRDWGHKNYYASLSPIDGKWRYHSWDAEKVFQGLNDDIVNASNNPGPTGIHQSLTENADYRIRFADAIQKHFFNGGVMSTEGLQRIYRRRTDEIGRAVILESARWGDAARSTPYTKEDWDAERDRLMDDYFVRRPDIAFNQFEDAGLTGDIETPRFSNESGYVEVGGKIAINKSIFAKGTIHYTLDGSDPRLPGGILSDSAIPYEGPIELSESATIKVRNYQESLFGGHKWSAIIESHFAVGAVAPAEGSLQITQINYRPAGASGEEASAGFSRKDFEFLAIANITDNRVNLRDIQFLNGIKFDFASADIQEIDGDTTIYLVKNRAAFEMRYGTGFAIAGEYTGSLSNDGEQLMAQYDNAALVDVTFNDNMEWPQGTDGEGGYLVLKDPKGGADVNAPGSWRASDADDVPIAVAAGGGNNNGGGGTGDYASWADSVFGPGAADTIAGPNADPDTDKVINYLEFLMGGDPNSPSSAPALGVSRNAEGQIIFEVPTRKDTGVTIGIEASGNLDGWTEVSGPALSALGANPTNDANVELRRYRVIQLTKDAPWTQRYVRASVPLP